jgi:hypothetical protein
MLRTALIFTITHCVIGVDYYTDVCAEKCAKYPEVCGEHTSSCDTSKGTCKNLFYLEDGSLAYGREMDRYAVRCPIELDRRTWFIDLAAAYESIHRSETAIDLNPGSVHHKAIMISKAEEIEYLSRAVGDTRDPHLVRAFKDICTLYTEFNELRDNQMRGLPFSMSRLEQLKSDLTRYRDRTQMEFYLKHAMPLSL